MDSYKLIYKIFAAPFRALFRVSVTGRENLPPKGEGYLFCANHTSLWDVFVLEVSVDRQLKFMAKKELFKIPLLRRIIKAAGAFPVNRGGCDVESLKNAINIIENGEAVGIFPQGTRHPGENVRDTEVKHGIGLIAYRAKCGIVPMHIKTEKRQVKFFRKTEIIIGKPVRYKDLGFANGGMKEYKAVANNMFDKICTLGEEAGA